MKENGWCRIEEGGQACLEYSGYANSYTLPR